MHVSIFNMPRFGSPRMAFTILAFGLISATLAPKVGFAQTASPGPAAASGKPSSVLDRIREKIRKSNSAEERVRKWFESLDQDNNAEISKQELFSNIRGRFDNMDTSGDKFVSKSEFGELDANADGRLSMAEFASPANWRFDRIDRNLDGKVSQQEAARLFDRPVGEATRDDEGECFYVERQVVRVKEEVAETFRRRGYPKAECAWTPDASDEIATRKYAQ
jgi:hypothetical protein